MSAKDMDIRRVRRLLRETARIAEHASLTGSLEKGSRLAIRQYNAIREHLQDQGVIPEDLFPELDEDDSGFDELGVAAKLMDGYLDGEDESDSSDSECKHKRVEIRLGGAAGIGNLGDLKNLGEIIRSHLPEILRDYVNNPPTPPTPPVPPTAPTPAEQPSAPVQFDGRGDGDVSDEMRDLIQQLRNADLSETQRAEIASEIVRLAQSG